MGFVQRERSGGDNWMLWGFWGLWLSGL
jgi:hypothetical protein